MQEVFDKIIEKQEELFQDLNVIEVLSHVDFDSTIQNSLKNFLKSITKESIEIVKQEAEKFGTDTNVWSNGWIPCSSGVMPKECITKDEYTDPSEEVLVYIYYGENCVNNGCGVSRYWEHTKFHKNPWIDLEYGKENVVAWQPLPLPFRDKE